MQRESRTFYVHTKRSCAIYVISMFERVMCMLCSARETSTSILPTRAHFPRIKHENNWVVN